MNDHHDPFIHCLPVEISSKIFIAYVDDINSTFDAYNAKGLEKWSPALHLSSICAQWRNIARCTAQIWRVIRVPLRQKPVNVKLLTELATELFSLSGQHTLSLGLYLVYYDRYLFRDYIERLDSLDDLPAITRAVGNRCRDIAFHGLPLEPIHYLLSGLDTPNLKSFSICRPYGDFESNYHYRFTPKDVSLLASPQLEEVEIFSGTRLLPSLQINWNNITTTRLYDINLNNTFRVLLLAPRLKTYTISYGEFGFPRDDGSWSPLPLDLPLTHTTLESLEFYSISHDAVAEFLQAVNFPSLKELKFFAPRGYGESPVKHLISFFERSPCPLLSFSIFLHYGTTDQEILNLFNALPTLTRFSINVPGGDAFTTDFFLRKLVQPTSGSINDMVAPRLESFSYSGLLNFTWPAFLEILEPPPRFLPHGVEHKRPRPLRKVSLRLKAEQTIPVDDDVLSKLQESHVIVNLETVPIGEITPFTWW